VLLDVIIATYNRKKLLRGAIHSVLDRQTPPELSVRVIVADNNSKDGTKDLVTSLTARFGRRLHYIFEPRQGKSYALNTAIAHSDADLIGIIDDDEELDAEWLNRACDLFHDPAVQYIGGRTLPKLDGPLPAWVPSSDFRAVIGWAEGPAECCAYSAERSDLFLMGGNAVFRRDFLRRLGPQPYDVTVGRKGRGLLGADDHMYQRLLSIGSLGVYDPRLIVYHAVQPYMLTKRYYRRWCYWSAVSAGALERAQPSMDPHLLGIPRWKVRRGLQSLGRLLVGKCSPYRQRRQASFLDELYVLQTAGWLHGHHFFREGERSDKRNHQAGALDDGSLRPQNAPRNRSTL
jgi:glycosyltransferase involved in cell wall biosynthesis